MPLRRLGTSAEDRAAQHLLSLGYALITRRCRVGALEIDLVALDGETLVFVEVKERRAGASPEESIGDRKIARLFAAADLYRAETGQTDRPYRFDVIAIDSQGLRHHVDAFR